MTQDIHLLIPHQAPQEKSGPSFLLVTPNHVLRLFCFLIPGTQKLSEAVMKQASPPCSKRFITLTLALAPLVIIYWHPSYGNPVLRLLTLVLMQVKNRHCPQCPDQNILEY